MPGFSEDLLSATAANARFGTTRWSLILSAQGESPAGREALEQLCQIYWLPVYALVRRRGCDPESAKDFTQEFFFKLLARHGLGQARRELGRFRAFLAQSVKNFLADEWDKLLSQKRGSGQMLVSLDAEVAEARLLEAPDDATPDKLFDRLWAEQLLAAAQARLRQEFVTAGKMALWEVMQSVGDPNAERLAAAAQRLGVPLNTLKSHLRRARLRQAEIIRELVADTVSTPAEVEAELKCLLHVLSD